VGCGRAKKQPRGIEDQKSSQKKIKIRTLKTVGCGTRLMSGHANCVNLTKVFNYDVAISFAGEQRKEAEAIADCLKKNEVKVFYDG
jgi:hypothetical protein